MDLDLLLIFGFIVVITIIATGMGFAIQKRSNEHEERKLELLARKAEAERGAPSAEMRKIEERLRVLERLATDRGQLLSDEIESLRTPDAAPISSKTLEKTR